MMKQVVGAYSVSLALTAAASAQTPAGVEFRVNTYTTGRQAYSRSAMEPDGDFVVVWMSAQDGSGYGAFGQRFGASGAPRGREFQINTYTTGSQRLPAVAVGSNGDFVVVWESVQDGSGGSIQGQRYDSTGSTIGGEFLVNTFTTGLQYRPHIGLASDGMFVVSWTSRPFVTYGGTGARRFDASGNPIGDELFLSSIPPSFQGFDDLAVESDGDFAVVREEGLRDSSGTAIIGQRFDASGNHVGFAFLVNSYTTGDQRTPSVSVSPAGGFVVAWTSPGDGSGDGMFAKRFDASWNAVGNDFVVNTFTTGNASGLYGRQVAHDARGNFVVTWTCPGGGEANRVLAQSFSASGVQRGAEFRVNTYTTNFQGHPSVASDSVGNFVVVWNSNGQDGSNVGIFAQRYGDLIFEDGFDPKAP